MKRVTVQEAAKRLGLPVDAIRGGLIQGSLPIGHAVKHKRWAYYITEKKLQDYIDGDGRVPDDSTGHADDLSV